jgi:hypothetical protein
MEDLTNETKLAIRQAILREWQQKAEAFEVRGRVAVKVHDEREAARTKAELENALKTIDALKEEIAEIEKVTG